MGITITHTNETMFFYWTLKDGATKDNEIIASVSEKKGNDHDCYYLWDYKKLEIKP